MRAAGKLRLQSLSPEVARADTASRERYQSRLRNVVEAILAGPASKGAPTSEAAALAALALLIGSVTLARAVPDEAFADRIAIGSCRCAATADGGKKIVRAGARNAAR